MKPQSKPIDSRARRAILQRLKENGPQDSKTLADQLGVSAMAIRQHLYQMTDEKLVTYEEESRPKGRPAKMWRLTPQADCFFPDGHADLTVSLIQAMGNAFGSKGLEKLLAERTRRQLDDYSRRIPKTTSIRRRVNALTRIRTEEGYMAHAKFEKDGSALLVENHCPICEAAAECQGLCATELELFQTVLGKDVTVERTDHIQAGSRRCAYRICPRR